MNGAIFVLALNVTIAVVMAAAFFAIAHFDRANRPARWLGCAMLAAAVSFGGEFVLKAGFYEPLSGLVIALSMLLTFVFIAQALAIRYGSGMPAAGLFAIVASSAVLYFLILGLPREDFVRQLLYQLPYALVCLLATWIVMRAPVKKALDRFLAGLMGFLTVYFLSKPYVALKVGGVGDTPAAYADTVYAAISQASGGMLLMGLAMMALAVVIRDSAAALIRRSERDPETGLLNQRGFETHAHRYIDELLTARDGQTSELALTLISVRDGGPSGEIEPLARAVAAALIDSSGQQALVGRMGPLEFAVFEPGVNLFGARQRADTMRGRILAARAAEPATGVSIGITEREQADCFADMLARALWALEEARLAGESSVRLAARSGLALTRPS